MTLAHDRRDTPSDIRGSRVVTQSHAVYVAERHEIGEGETRKVVDDVLPEPVAVFNSGGAFFALADTCSHGSASLSDGWVENCMVACPLHFSEFDLTTGKARTLPAMNSVNTYLVEVRGESIYIIGPEPDRAPTQPREKA